jgi:hypothetical protein
MGKYLLNTNSKTIHKADSKDGRCRIEKMRPEFKQFFDSLDEAKKFPKEENPLAKCCSFCLPDEAKKRKSHM